MSKTLWCFLQVSNELKTIILGVVHSVLVWYSYLLNSCIRKTMGIWMIDHYCKAVSAQKHNGILGTCMWGLHARLEEH